MAMAGDIGGSVGPAAVGIVTQAANDNLKAGMISAGVFPAVMFIALIWMGKHTKRNRQL